MHEAVIAATAFVGALVQSALLTIIWDVALGVGNRIRGQPNVEVSLKSLSGMNAWEDHNSSRKGSTTSRTSRWTASRLFVVTREGGLRILDSMNEAILYNAATPEVRAGLKELGVRTAYDLFLAFRAHGLVAVTSAAGDPTAYRWTSRGQKKLFLA